MRQWRKQYHGFLLFVMAFGFLLSMSVPIRAQGSVTGHVLVKTKSGVDANKLAGDYQTSVEDHVPKTTLYPLFPPANTDDQTFAKLLSHQEPFSVTQTNDFPLYSVNSATAPTATGCTTTQSAYTYTNSQGQTESSPCLTA